MRFIEYSPYIYIGLSFIGLFISRYNYIIILLALDLILFSISLLFIFTGLYNNDISGQIYAFLLLPIAVTETSLGLSLLVVSYKNI
jgi:NADH-quinone oxidoreductase subunit K